MGITYRFNPDLGFIHAVCDGFLTIDDMQAFWLSRLEERGGQDCCRYLADLRGCVIGCTGPELQRLVDAMKPRTPMEPKRRVAILVDGPLQYGTSRQFQVFFEGLGTSEICGDEAEAMAWLLAAS